MTYSVYTNSTCTTLYASHQPTGNPGRQHWPSCYSAILAGAGIRGGAVYGESDRIGAYVKDRPVRPQDLGATIYHALGVPLDLRLGRDGFTRPITKTHHKFLLVSRDDQAGSKSGATIGCMLNGRKMSGVPCAE